MQTQHTSGNELHTMQRLGKYRIGPIYFPLKSDMGRGGKHHHHQSRGGARGGARGGWRGNGPRDTAPRDDGEDQGHVSVACDDDEPVKEDFPLNLAMWVWMRGNVMIIAMISINKNDLNLYTFHQRLYCSDADGIACVNMT
jgi:hypothetical protein